jgi:hypothetical protein
MNKLLAAAALVAVMTPAHAEFGSTNAEKGCTILSINVATKVEDLPFTTTEKCARMKASTLDAVRGKDASKAEGSPWFACTITSLMTRNRIRGVPDFDPPPLEVRKNITKACLMIMNDIDEDRATYLVNKTMKE